MLRLIALAVTVAAAQPLRAADGSLACGFKPLPPAVAPNDAASGRGAAPDSADRPLAARRFAVPVEGYARERLRDMFNERRGTSRGHEAIDLPAPRGTPVVAVDDGCIVKLFTSVPGGLTLYQFDRDGRYAYYYAHLDRYAATAVEGRPVKRGDVIGHVGSTGNASGDAPHLHFAIFRLGPERQWWKGTPVNPYPLLSAPER